MDVPYNKSGASSRAHYQIVRNVENTPHQSEQLLLQEVERIRQRIAGRMVSTAELRKDLIVLLYCLNSSFGAINGATLAFALPSAVHLAEAGSRVSEKRIGYLFCSEVMPQEHELQLMLVNTIRKDLTSTSNAKINIALESLVNFSSEEVIPAVQTRCVELLSHPSTRIRVLAMDAIHSLSRLAPDLLNDENVKHLILKRLSDSDESVVRAALKLSISVVESDLLEGEKIMRPSISLVSRLSDKHTARNYSSAFTVTSLSIVSRLYEREDSKSKADYANELLPSLLSILRRAVKHDRQPVILECFRLLGHLPLITVIQYLIKSSSQPIESHRPECSDSPQPQFVHPVARIRHFLSSRTVNDHFLFLSCLVSLDPSLWAGVQQPRDDLLSPTVGEQQADGDGDGDGGRTSGIPPVLDQMEVERVLSFLESEDEQIRSLTLRILISLDPSLVESCYARALDALRAFDSPRVASDQARKVVVQRLLELAFTISLGNKKLEEESGGHAFIQKIREVADVADARDRVNGAIVEFVLSRIRKEHTSVQRTFILSLLSLLAPSSSKENYDVEPLNATLLLILIALACEMAPIFASFKTEVVSMICLFTTAIHSSPISMQEPLLLCMTRLVTLLSSTEISSLEMEDVRRVVHELGETSLTDKKRVLVLKRCEQFAKASTDPHMITELLGNNQNVSLPEFALLLDQAERRLSSRDGTPRESSSPLTRLTSPIIGRLELSPLSQSKLRYDAYAPPPTASASRLVRAHSHSSAASGRSSNRVSSQASSIRPGEHDADAELSQTVTAGELTLAAGSRNEFVRVHRTRKGEVPEGEQTITNIARNDIPAKSASNLLAFDSPFLPEPLVDMDSHAPATPPASSPYVSASSSLRTSPEPGPSFEELWSALAANGDAFSARGWCDDAADVAVRRLQSMGLRMDVLPADVAPFEGDLKISLHFASFEALGSHLPCALLRVHEEGDGSCLWQVRCTDKELGLKVKILMG